MRRLDLPAAALELGGLASKADLLEAAWELAALSNPKGADDEAATLRRLIEVVNGNRKRRGQRPQLLSRRLREIVHGGAK